MYVIGLPLVAAKDSLLRSKHLFGRYGRIQKIALSRSAPARGRAAAAGGGGCASAYLQFSTDEEAKAAIRGMNNMVLEGRILK